MRDQAASLRQLVSGPPLLITLHSAVARPDLTETGLKIAATLSRMGARTAYGMVAEAGECDLEERYGALLEECGIPVVTGNQGGAGTAARQDVIRECRERPVDFCILQLASDLSKSNLDAIRSSDLAIFAASPGIPEARSSLGFIKALQPYLDRNRRLNYSYILLDYRMREAEDLLLERLCGSTQRLLGYPVSCMAKIMQTEWDFSSYCRQSGDELPGDTARRLHREAIEQLAGKMLSLRK